MSAPQAKAPVQHAPAPPSAPVAVSEPIVAKTPALISEASSPAPATNPGPLVVGGAPLIASVAELERLIVAAKEELAFLNSLLKIAKKREGVVA